MRHLWLASAMLLSALPAEEGQRPHKEAMAESARWDADGDGTLNEEEADAQERESGEGSRRMGGLDRELQARAVSVEQIRARFDANSDGRLDEADARTLAKAMGARDELIAARYDLNDDGRLSAPELSHMRRELSPLLFDHLRTSQPELFRVLDRDGDDRLDFPEIMRGAAYLREAKQRIHGEEREEQEEQEETRRERSKKEE